MTQVSTVNLTAAQQSAEVHVRQTVLCKAYWMRMRFIQIYACSENQALGNPNRYRLGLYSNFEIKSVKFVEL